ncbi:nucleotide exchange factor GrpE [Gloeobacter violaceus]|uniref:Protein GrpE n=1 Tax=Gloeobacter violaceus (strain ATCC 29082 / PCC 7421) TaxID=251221 RepID=GRPE_GLOVI|nr:nucleotide exchange factor GrpE [Gloeobacter violaceus]Q7NDP1.1 RecName: Full=Protein GrpE; AltName: Full=HSP-70 cofactor [Gloeobacter violaceus PCC 7421]BAC92135.1 heat shock protein [Gloeobacter violaceus PCC 7421]
MAENERTTENFQPQDPSYAEAATTEASAAEATGFIARIDQLAAENSDLQKKLADYEQKYTRLMADFDNFRKRTQREKDELAYFVSAKLLKDILPVFDNFDRARAFAQPDNEREEKLHNSYQQVYRQFLSVLEKMGVTAMEAIGQPFDPAQHEAILREESAGVSQETVVAELQKGYLLADKVLRPAMVKVAIPEAGS